MKRTILLIPLVAILLLVLLNACTPPGGTTPVPIYMWTAMAQTLTATNLPPPPTVPPTATPDVPTILNALNIPPNDTFAQRLDQLEDAISVAYEVYNVEFLPLNAQTTVLQVDVRCQCAQAEQCCSNKRGFVYALSKMYPYASYISGQVPSTVKTLTVVTYVQSGPLPPVSADWANVQSFLRLQTDGKIFGSQVTVPPPAAP